MMLTLRGLPPDIKRAHIQSLIKKQCGIADFILLDNLKLSNRSLTQRVTLCCDDEDAREVIAKLNGFALGLYQLAVCPAQKEKKSSTFDILRPSKARKRSKSDKKFTKTNCSAPLDDGFSDFESVRNMTISNKCENFLPSERRRSPIKDRDIKDINESEESYVFERPLINPALLKTETTMKKRKIYEPHSSKRREKIACTLGGYYSDISSSSSRSPSPSVVTISSDESHNESAQGRDIKCHRIHSLSSQRNEKESSSIQREKYRRSNKESSPYLENSHRQLKEQSSNSQTRADSPNWNEDDMKIKNLLDDIINTEFELESIIDTKDTCDSQSNSTFIDLTNIENPEQIDSNAKFTKSSPQSSSAPTHQEKSHEPSVKNKTLPKTIDCLSDDDLVIDLNSEGDNLESQLKTNNLPLDPLSTDNLLKMCVHAPRPPFQNKSCDSKINVPSEPIYTEGTESKVLLMQNEPYLNVPMSSSVNQSKDNFSLKVTTISPRQGQISYTETVAQTTPTKIIDSQAIQTIITQSHSQMATNNTITSQKSSTLTPNQDVIIHIDGTPESPKWVPSQTMIEHGHGRQIMTTQNMFYQTRNHMASPQGIQDSSRIMSQMGPPEIISPTGRPQLMSQTRTFQIMSQIEPSQMMSQIGSPQTMQQWKLQQPNIQFGGTQVIRFQGAMDKEMLPAEKKEFQRGYTRTLTNISLVEFQPKNPQIITTQSKVTMVEPQQEMGTTQLNKSNNLEQEITTNLSHYKLMSQTRTFQIMSQIEPSQMMSQIGSPQTMQQWKLQQPNIQFGGTQVIRFQGAMDKEMLPAEKKEFQRGYTRTLTNISLVEFQPKNPQIITTQSKVTMVEPQQEMGTTQLNKSNNLEQEITTNLSKVTDNIPKETATSQSNTLIDKPLQGMNTTQSNVTDKLPQEIATNPSILITEVSQVRLSQEVVTSQSNVMMDKFPQEIITTQSNAMMDKLPQNIATNQSNVTAVNIPKEILISQSNVTDKLPQEISTNQQKINTNQLIVDKTFQDIATCQSTMIIDKLPQEMDSTQSNVADKMPQEKASNSSKVIADKVSQDIATCQSTMMMGKLPQEMDTTQSNMTDKLPQEIATCQSTIMIDKLPHKMDTTQSNVTDKPPQKIATTQSKVITDKVSQDIATCQSTMMMDKPPQEIDTTQPNVADKLPQEKATIQSNVVIHKLTQEIDTTQTNVIIDKLSEEIYTTESNIMDKLPQEIATSQSNVMIEKKNYAMQEPIIKICAEQNMVNKVIQNEYEGENNIIKIEGITRKENNTVQGPYQEINGAINNNIVRYIQNENGGQSIMIKTEKTKDNENTIELNHNIEEEIEYNGDDNMEVELSVSQISNVCLSGQPSKLEARPSQPKQSIDCSDQEGPQDFLTTTELVIVPNGGLLQPIMWRVEITQVQDRSLPTFLSQLDQWKLECTCILACEIMYNSNQLMLPIRFQSSDYMKIIARLMEIVDERLITLLANTYPDNPRGFIQMYRKKFHDDNRVLDDVAYELNISLPLPNGGKFRPKEIPKRINAPTAPEVTLFYVINDCFNRSCVQNIISLDIYNRCKVLYHKLCLEERYLVSEIRVRVKARVDKMLGYLLGVVKSDMLWMFREIYKHSDDRQFLRNVVREVNKEPKLYNGIYANGVPDETSKEMQEKSKQLNKKPIFNMKKHNFSKIMVQLDGDVWREVKTVNANTYHCYLESRSKYVIRMAFNRKSKNNNHTMGLYLKQTTQQRNKRKYKKPIIKSEESHEIDKFDSEEIKYESEEEIENYISSLLDDIKKEKSLKKVRGEMSGDKDVMIVEPKRTTIIVDD